MNVPKHTGGFVLIPVVIALVLIAAISLALGAQGVTRAQLTSGEIAMEQLRYAAEAGLQHARSRLANQSSCADYTDIANTAFGDNSYAVTLSATSGSPIEIQSTSTSGSNQKTASATVTQRVYQPESTAILQPGGEGTDTYIRDGANDDNNFGAATILKVNNASAEEASLIQFDLSSLPAGADIIEARLSLYLAGGDAVTDGVVDVFRVTRDWVEGVEDGNQPAALSGATYVDYDGTSRWDTEGGDYERTAMASVSINALTPAWYDWDITSVASQWHSGATANYGVIVRASSGDVDKIFFTSSDGVAAERPTLTLRLVCECGQVCPVDQTNPSVNGLIAHWPLDDASGTTAVDIVGNNDGTLNNGPAWVSGRVDGAVELDGGDDYIDAGIFDVEGDGLTMSAWFYADVISDQGRMISKATSVNANDAWWQLGMDGSSGAYYLRMRIKADGSTTTFRDSNQPLTTQRWYMATATYDATSGTMALYLNGALASSTTHGRGGALDTDDTVPVWIGANGSPARYFDGILDDVRLYDRALDATEVSALYEEQRNSGRVAYWTFDETAGATAEDSALDNDGTVVGAGWTDGKVAGALSFDGSSDVVQVPDALTTDYFSGRFTVMSWVYDASNGNTSQRIISKETTGANDQFWMAFSFGTLFIGVDGNFYAPSFALATDTWYHIAATYDDDEDSLLVYIDGILVLDQTTTASLTDNAEPLYIGSNWEGSKYWEGLIDDVQIFDRVLDARDIAEAAADGAGSLVAHWPLNDASGTTAEDIAGANDGTLRNGPAWSSGQIGGALAFDGVNDDVSIGALDVIGSGLTMTGWFNANAFADDGRIISKASGVVEADAWWQLSYADRGSDNYLRVRIKADGISTTLHDNTTALTAGRWYHAAATYDEANATMRLYLDGVEIANRTHPRGGPVDTNAAVAAAIGSNGTAERYFDGLIDDVRLYNYALDATQIAELTTTGSGGSGSGCSGNYRDEFTSQSYSRNDGTLNWSSDWIEVSETDGATAGDVRGWSDGGESVLRVRDNDNGGEGVYRSFSLTGATTATLTFRYRRNGLDNANDFVAIYISDTGANGTFTELPAPRIEGGGSDSSYQVYSRDISSYISGDVALLLSGSSSLGATDTVYFDDIDISCVP